MTNIKVDGRDAILNSDGTVTMDGQTYPVDSYGNVGSGAAIIGRADHIYVKNVGPMAVPGTAPTTDSSAGKPSDGAGESWKVQQNLYVGAGEGHGVYRRRQARRRGGRVRGLAALVVGVGVLGGAGFATWKWGYNLIPPQTVEGVPILSKPVLTLDANFASPLGWLRDSAILLVDFSAWDARAELRQVSFSTGETLFRFPHSDFEVAENGAGLVLAVDQRDRDRALVITDHGVREIVLEKYSASRDTRNGDLLPDRRTSFVVDDRVYLEFRTERVRLPGGSDGGLGPGELRAWRISDGAALWATRPPADCQFDLLTDFSGGDGSIHVSGYCGPSRQSRSVGFRVDLKAGDVVEGPAPPSGAQGPRSGSYLTIERAIRSTTVLRADWTSAADGVGSDQQHVTPIATLVGGWASGDYSISPDKTVIILSDSNGANIWRLPAN